MVVGEETINKDDGAVVVRYVETTDVKREYESEIVKEIDFIDATMADLTQRRIVLQAKLDKFIIK